MEDGNLVMDATGIRHLQNFRWTLHPDGDLVLDHPHARGTFAGIHEAQIQTTTGTVEILPGQDDTFIRLGTKFKTPEQLGPQSQFNPAPCVVTGKATLRFRKPN